jgi:hypothetical protein
MYHPPYFLEKHWHAVETTREKADVAFAEWSKRQPDASEAARDQARIDLVIKPVFFAFAHALCDAARLALIPVEEFHHELNRELTNFRLILSAELRPANADVPSAGPVPAFDRAAQDAILDSPEWIAHLQERAAVRASLLGPTPRNATGLLSNKKAAKFLDVSVSSIRRYEDAGILPYVKMGKNRHVSKADLIRLRDQGTSRKKI